MTGIEASKEAGAVWALTRAGRQSDVRISGHMLGFDAAQCLQFVPPFKCICLNFKGLTYGTKPRQHGEIIIRNKLLRLRGAALWLERRRRWARSVGLPRNKFLVPLLKLSTETSMWFAKSSKPFSKRLCQIASTSPLLAPPQSFNHLTTRFPDFQGLGNHIYKAVAILPLLLQMCNS